MWIAPPSGLRFISAATTPSVSCVTSSRTRDDAAPWPPWMARNALVIAMVILAGSKPTTEPLRRITLYCAKRGSDAFATALPGSPTIRSRGGAAVGEVEAVEICMGRSPCLELVLVDDPAWSAPRGKGAFARSLSVLLRGPGDGRGPGQCRNPRNSLPEPPANLLSNQNLLYLVFQCRLNTKNSGRTCEVQGLFDPPRRAAKKVR